MLSRVSKSSRPRRAGGPPLRVTLPTFRPALLRRRGTRAARDYGSELQSMIGRYAGHYGRERACNIMRFGARGHYVYWIEEVEGGSCGYFGSMKAEEDYADVMCCLKTGSASVERLSRDRSDREYAVSPARAGAADRGDSLQAPGSIQPRMEAAILGAIEHERRA